MSTLTASIHSACSRSERSLHSRRTLGVRHVLLVRAARRLKYRRRLVTRKESICEGNSEWWRDGEEPRTRLPASYTQSWDLWWVEWFYLPIYVIRWIIRRDQRDPTLITVSVTRDQTDPGDKETILDIIPPGVPLLDKTLHCPLTIYVFEMYGTR